jgi:hypothetical protein
MKVTSKKCKARRICSQARNSSKTKKLIIIIIIITITMTMEFKSQKPAIAK